VCASDLGCGEAADRYDAEENRTAACEGDDVFTVYITLDRRYNTVMLSAHCGAEIK